MSKLIENSKKVKIEKIEDKWIISKLNSLTKTITEELENLHPHLATRSLKNFWLNDLSRGYIQVIRERLSENDKSANYVLREVYLKLVKLCAPIIPFITEQIWQELRKQKIVKEESIHLCSWPKADKKKINEKLEKEFSSALEIIEKGLASRADVGIGLKWPLSRATIFTDKKISKELQEVIKRQLNVKKIEIKEGRKIEVRLDMKITADLEEEGYAREIARNVQAARKKAGLVKGDKIDLFVLTDLNLKEHEKFIKERTNADKLIIVKNIDDESKKVYKNKEEMKIKDKKIEILFNKM